MEIKNTLVRILIEGLAKLLANEELWKEAVMLVDALWDESISGEEKAKQVKSHLARIGNITSKALLNLLNELAYWYVKSLKKG